MKKKRRAGSEDIVIEGSGNVFADLGLPNPDQELIKAWAKYRGIHKSDPEMIDEDRALPDEFSISS